MEVPQESGFTRFIPFRNNTSFSVSLGRSTCGVRVQGWVIGGLEMGGE